MKPIPATPIRTLAALARGDSSGHARVTVERDFDMIDLSAMRDGVAIRYRAVTDADRRVAIKPVAVRAEALRTALTGATTVLDARPVNDGIEIVTDVMTTRIPGTAALDVGAMGPMLGGVELGADAIAHLAWVARAMGTPGNRYGTDCVAVEDGGTRFAATDGNRLHFADVAPTFGAGLTLGDKRHLPRALVELAVRLCRGALVLAMGDGGDVYAAGDGWTLRQRIHIADLPDYRVVLPGQGKITSTAKVSGRDIGRALAPLVRVVQDRTSRGIGCEPYDGGVVLCGVQRDTEAVSSVRVEIESGAWMPCWVQAPYLRDAVAGAAGDVELAFTSPMGPIRVTQAGTKRTAIVMPLRGAE